MDKNLFCGREKYLREVQRKYWHIILAEVLVILSFTVFYGMFGDFTVDSYREAYIPSRILAGKVLYKNILTIYAPFSYLFNAFLYAIFGIKLKVLYFAGLFTTMGIFGICAKISDKFLEKKYTFSILLFMAGGLILSPNAFSPFFPYSFGILYGLLFVLGSLYFALNKKFPQAYLMYSLAVCSKYEFIFLLPLLVFLSGKKDWIKNITAMSVPVIAVFLPLFITGLNIKDIADTFNIIFLMTSTKTLHWFYSVTGLIFRPETILIYITNFIKFFIPGNLYNWQEVIIWSFPAIAILFILRFRNLNTPEKIFISASLLISVKVFFALTLQSYGVFFIPFALISLFILTPSKYREILFVFVILWSFITGAKNIQALTEKNTSVLNEAVNFVENNTKQTDKVVVYPEGLRVNVLTGRASDDKFYSLIPLYVETFGEDVIIKRLKITKPEYVITTSYDTSAYYYKKFGEDYGIKIKNQIKKDYRLVHKTGFAEYYKLN